MELVPLLVTKIFSKDISKTIRLMGLVAVQLLITTTLDSGKMVCTTAKVS